MKKLIWVIGMVVCLYAGDTIIYVGEFDPVDKGIYDAYVKGDIGYLSLYPAVGSDSSQGILFVDLTDRANPQEINHLYLPTMCFGIEIKDTLAYLGSKQGLWVINIKDPLNPQIVSSINPYALEYLKVIDTICYATTGDNGLYIIDIKDPSSPSVISHYTSFNPNYHFLSVYNNVVFTSAGDQIHSIDVSNPSNPVLLDTLYTPYIPGQGWLTAYGMDVFYPYLYVAVARGFWIVDISEPSNLKSETLIVDTPRYSYDVVIKDTLLFTGGPAAWNLNPDPSSPVKIAQYASMGYSQDLFVDSSLYIYEGPRAVIYPWRIYKFEYVGIKESGSEGGYFDFKKSKDGMEILYGFPYEVYGKIYITDKSGRILKILKKGILSKGKLFWEAKKPGTYFLILDTENKKIRRKINIVK